MPGLNIFSWGSLVSPGYVRGQWVQTPSASYMSLLCVHAQLTLQTGHQPLVRVVRRQPHQLHPPLDLRAHMKTGHESVWRKYKTKTSQRAEFAHVFRTTQGKGDGSKHKRTSIPKLSIRILLLKDDGWCQRCLCGSTAAACGVSTGRADDPTEALVKDKQQTWTLRYREHKSFFCPIITH